MTDQHRTIRSSRRALLAGGAGIGLAGPLAGLAGSPAVAREAAAPAVRGADISFTLQLERAGATWQRNGRTAPVERLFREAGCTWTRLRVWVDPPRGFSTLGMAVQLARRSRRAGMRVLLDLHYSDFWADPAHQSTPDRWRDLAPRPLAEQVRRYTRNAVERLERAGAPVDMVQVGNEITGGMLWPTGKIYGDPGAPENWDGFADLLRAGLDGVREARVARRPETMVHIDRGGSNGDARYFYDHLQERGVEFDVIGLSYYPFWHGPLSALRANVTDLTQRYDRDVVIVETAYPWTLRNGDRLENHVDQAEELPDSDRWPATPAGQAAYFRALRRTITRVPGGRCRGFFAWEPEWLPGVGWKPGAGNPNDNLTLFDFRGRALPGLEAAYGR